MAIIKASGLYSKRIFLSDGGGGAAIPTFISAAVSCEISPIGG